MIRALAPPPLSVVRPLKKEFFSRLPLRIRLPNVHCAYFYIKQFNIQQFRIRIQNLVNNRGWIQIYFVAPDLSGQTRFRIKIWFSTQSNPDPVFFRPDPTLFRCEIPQLCSLVLQANAYQMHMMHVSPILGACMLNNYTLLYIRIEACIIKI